MLHPLAIQRSDDAPALTDLRDEVIQILRTSGDQAAAVAAIDQAGHRLMADARRYLLAPPAKPRNDWVESVPDYIWAFGIEERFELILGSMHGLIGPSEITGILKVASMVAPMNDRGFGLLMWATSRTMQRKGTDPAEFWRIISEGRPIAEDADVVDPGGRYHRDYRDTAHHILNALVRRQPVDEARDKRKTTRKVNTRQPTLDGQAAVAEEQLDLLP